MNIGRILWNAILVFVLIMPGYAASGDDALPTITLVTPPLFVEGADIIKCTAVNLHRRAVVVDIRVFNAAGEQTCGAGPRRLKPGQAESQDCNSDIFSDPNPIRYCEFIYKGRKNLVQGTAQAIVGSDPIGVTVPAQFVRANVK
jgi:hypothetical protein